MTKSSERFGKLLKVNIPEFLQGIDTLDSYLEVGGEVFGDVFDEIDDLKKIKSYASPNDGLVDLNLHEMGFEIPVNIKLSVKKQALRDVAEIHKRRGTRDGILHLLRMVGVDAEASSGWLLNPEQARKGWTRDYFTREEKRFSLGNRVHTEFLYGEVTDTETGTFFEGYGYWDIDKEKKSAPLPIVGEVYDYTGSMGEDVIEATPYLIVRFEDEDIFLVDANESTDPETGEVFPYTVNERFQLLEDIIQFFLIGEYRPTTMRIIVEAKLLSFEDSSNITEKFQLLSNDGRPADRGDTAKLHDEMTITSSVIGEVNQVGDRRIAIGRPTPIYGRDFGVNLRIEPIEQETTMVETWGMTVTEHHFTSGIISELIVPLLGETIIDLSWMEDTGTKVTGILPNSSEDVLHDRGVNGVFEIDARYSAIRVRAVDQFSGRLSFITVRRSKDET